MLNNETKEVQSLNAKKEKDWNPLVSCLMILHNEEKFVAEAIESQLSQSYSNWELLIVDDGSTDNTPQIIENFHKRFPDKIHCFYHPDKKNCGMSASRKLAFSKAKGEFITILDGDDVISSRKTQEQLEIMKENPEVGMVYGRFVIWHSWSEVSDIKDHIVPLGIASNSILPPPKLIGLLYTRNLQRPGPFVMLRKTVVEEIGGWELILKNMYEDFAFYMKVGANTSVYVSDCVWGSYRQHQESCCHTLSRYESQKVGIALTDWTENYLTEIGMSDSKVWKTFRKNRARYRRPPLLQAIRDITKKNLVKLTYKLVRICLPKILKDWMWARVNKNELYTLNEATMSGELQ